MEPISDYKSYSEFEVVSRKNKKKRRQRKKQFSSPEELQSESETFPQMESTGDSNPVDDSDSELGSDDIGNKDGAEEQVNNSDLPNMDSSNVFRDGMMSAPPKIEMNLETEMFLDKEFSGKSNHIIYGTPVYRKDSKVFFPEPVDEQYAIMLNTRALSKNASTYELEKFEKNALIIFNQENIVGHEKRLGTQKDVDMLKDTFKNFNFEVVEYKDYTRDEILDKLKAFTSNENNWSDYGCVAVAVLTHGSSSGLLRAKDLQFSEIEIIKHFKVINNQTLVTKPKLIIIQACRGTKIIPGVPVLHAGKIRRDVDDAVEPYILPVESDMLILHSSYEGSPSHRNELHGSWFIQELCKKIDSLAATHDLETIMTEVKREVAINKQHEEYNRRTHEFDINKQMPVITSTLIRKLYLKKYGEASPKLETVADRPRESVSSEYRSEVLDSTALNTPLLCQFGPCSCFLEHFNYMRTCLKYFIEENPNDETAKSMWEVANAFEDGVEFNTCKEKMNQAISRHLYRNAQTSEYFKYLYLTKQ